MQKLKRGSDEMRFAGLKYEGLVSWTYFVTGTCNDFLVQSRHD